MMIGKMAKLSIIQNHRSIFWREKKRYWRRQPKSFVRRVPLSVSELTPMNVDLSAAAVHHRDMFAEFCVKLLYVLYSIYRSAAPGTT